MTHPSSLLTFSHGESRFRQKCINADIARRSDEAKTALEEERRFRRCDVEEMCQRHAAEVADMSRQLTATSVRVILRCTASGYGDTGPFCQRDKAR